LAISTTKAHEADPAVAEGLHLLDNAPQYLRSKAAQEIHNVVGDLSRAQERLFTLMADSSSRENLRANHPQESVKRRTILRFSRHSEVQALEQELTAARRRWAARLSIRTTCAALYDKYVAGVNKPQQKAARGVVHPSTASSGRKT